MLPLPNLDDRSFEDIKKEAINNIIKHCPEWTNHNSSDPGITLVELFSAMTDMLQYRINLIPEKNYLAFLDMLGIKGRIISPSKTRVKFSLSEGYQSEEDKKDAIKIKQYTIIGTDDDDTIMFETVKETYISNIKIKNIISKIFIEKENKYHLIDHTDNFLNKDPFTPFELSENTTNKTAIYIYGDSLSSLKDKTLFSIYFRIPTGIKNFNYISEKSFLKRLDWEFFNGENWEKLSISNYEVSIDNSFDTTDANILIVSFNGNNKSFKKSLYKEEIQSEETYIIRAFLRESKKWLSDFEVYEISISIESKLSGINPDNINYRDNAIDLNNNFYIFGDRPKNDYITHSDEYFHMKSNEAFSKVGAKINLNVKHSEDIDYIMPKGYNLKLLWRYYNLDDQWVELHIEDYTNNFTHNGSINFTVPEDISKIDINGNEGYWIQCLIKSGDYGKAETKEFRNGEEIVTSVNTLVPPKLSQISISYSLARYDLPECTVFNNNTYSKKNFGQNNISKLFDQENSKEQSLSFCFDSYISNRYIDIYFDIDENVITSNNKKHNINKNERVLIWELLIGTKWVSLEIVDETDELTKKGDIRIYLPIIDDLYSLEVNDKMVSGMWIRARVKYNSLVKIPKIFDILTNTVLANQEETIYNEYVGQSVGMPDMKFKLEQNNISRKLIVTIGKDEYKHVNRFIDCDKNSKVFTYSFFENEIYFGDGQYGYIPEVDEEIYISYARTQGKKGNIDKNKVNNLQESIKFVDSVTNIIPAIDGANGDTVEDLKKYAPSILKTRDRAITIEDYEFLAMEFSSHIVNAKASNYNGDIYIVIVTTNILEEDGFINRKLIQDLEDYLKSKSLITVKPFVKSPNITSISISLKIKTTNEQYDLSKYDLEEILNKKAKKYFNIIKGGSENKGYPMGKNITKADLYKLLIKIDSGLYFDKIDINKQGDRLEISDDSIVKFNKIIVEDLSYDD